MAAHNSASDSPGRVSTSVMGLLGVGTWPVMAAAALEVAFWPSRLVESDTGNAAGGRRLEPYQSSHRPVREVRAPPRNTKRACQGNEWLPRSAFESARYTMKAKGPVMPR